MPELPDLQVFSLNLQKKLSGKKLEKFTLVNQSKVKVAEISSKATWKNKRLKLYTGKGKNLELSFQTITFLGCI